VDRDGDLDLLVNNFRQPPALFRNTQAAGNHWLGLRLHGRGNNAEAIGARVTVLADGKSLLREVSCGNGYLGQTDEVVSVGLGHAKEATVTIRWPDGHAQTITHVNADAILDVTQDV
jgi:hypothetical protein